jgi:hypothetical protein
MADVSAETFIGELWRIADDRWRIAVCAVQQAAEADGRGLQPRARRRSARILVASRAAAA